MSNKLTMNKIKFLNHLFFCFVLTLLFSGCYSSKELVYLQKDDFNEEYPTAIKNNRPAYRLQPNDVLHVDIQNPDAETTNFFNFGTQQANNINSQAMLYIMGYSIDLEGFIHLPLIGKVKVENLTVEEANLLLQREADKYIRNSAVNVKLVSFKISVMGEVSEPGYYYVYNGQATVLEGLSLAGDITREGNRKDIKLIRQTDEGVEVIKMDITDADLLESKYFYLLPNDVIYVEPNKEGLKRANLQPLGIVFSGISALILISNFFFNNVLDGSL